MKTISTALVAFSMIFTGHVFAQDLQKGIKAYEGKNYASAFKEFNTLAQRGHDEAQRRLGMMYYFGDGVKQDYKEAVFWYRKSAEQGNPAAQNNIAFMYMAGKGILQDYKEAFRWYSKSASQGHPIGQGNLGGMYRDGNGVKQDLVYAHMWFNVAASNGYDNGQKNRDEVAKFLAASDISRAQNLARECVKKKYLLC